MLISLSPAELERLDPRVDIAQLEQLLARLPREMREMALNGFLLDPDPSLATVVGATNPTLDQHISSIMQLGEDDRSTE